MPGCSVLLIHVLMENGTKKKKKWIIIDDELENLLLSSG